MKEIQYQKKYMNKLANAAKELLTDEYRDYCVQGPNRLWKNLYGFTGPDTDGKR